MGSQAVRVAIGAALAVAAIWGAWTISNGGDPNAGQEDARGAAANGELQVDVSGVRSDRGFVIGTLCREGEKFPAGCRLEAKSKARQGVVTLSFGGLRKGDYALALYHDENDDSKLELGTEGIGFSNNANLAHEPPKFDASRIEVDGATRIRVRIRYSL